MTHRRRTGTARRRITDDEAMALCLVTTWALRTGRDPLRPPYTDRSARELEDFWSDQATAEGGSARPAAFEVRPRAPSACARRARNHFTP